MNIKSIRDGYVYFQALLPDRRPVVWDYACKLDELLALVRNRQLAFQLSSIVTWEDDF